MKSLCWDYNVSEQAMLDVIDGTAELADGVFDRKKLLVRCLERLPWHYVTSLWDKDVMLELYGPELSKRLFPKQKRSEIDGMFAILRKEPLPHTGWGDEYSKSLRRTFLSDRWNRVEQGVLQS
jgi:hypothetical protein